MRRILQVAFVAAFPLSAAAGPQEDAQALFDKFTADFTAADPDIIARHFDVNALFWGTNSRSLIQGRDNIRQYFSDAFKRLPGAKASPVGSVSVLAVKDDVMAVSGVWQNARTVEGKSVVTENRNSITLVKKDGQWLIVSFANSPRPRAP